ncbi:MAG: adenosylcobalamin-dependent ribonucleoside-diphosphate reductase [Candidatus Anstonellales archaeon]
MDNVLYIYRKLYMMENENTPMDVHRRVASYIANCKIEEHLFMDILNSDEFRPNSPCLINSGMKEGKNNLCACFVYGLEDSMESIVDWWKTSSLIYSGAGGVGVNIGRLREKNSPISGGGKSSGPIAFMKVIQSISEIVKSGGRSRRAANLISMHYSHPDIIEFITCKEKYNLNAMNISVLLDSKFFECLEMNSYINLISPNKNEIVGKIKASEIWNKICESAWKTGDPGLLFYDAINSSNPYFPEMEITSTNPCGEVPLPDFSACVIGSINLNKIIKDGSVDYNKFENIIKVAVLFLNNVIDKSSYPHYKIKENMMKYRPIGLGIMGFADILIKLGIEYGSEHSIKLFDDITSFLTKKAFEASIDISENTGRTIEIKNREKFESYLRRYGVSDEYIEKFREYGIMNSSVTSIAPTGSISISCGCSYTFEPLFSILWEKKISESDDILTFFNSEFEKFIPEISKESGKSREEIMSDISKNKGSIKNINYISEDIKKRFRTSMDIDYRNKLRLHSVGQKNITLGISTTYILPNNSTVDDVKNIFMEAYKMGIKGITIFRDGCLEDQPVIFGSSSNKVSKNRSMIRFGKTIEVPTPRGTLFMTGNYNKDGKLMEVFLNLGKHNSFESTLLNTIGRLISRALQYGVPPEVVIDTMIDTSGDKFWAKIDESSDRPEIFESVIDLIAKIMIKHYTSMSYSDFNGNRCPRCGGKMVYGYGGCRGYNCLNCGYSNCS